MKKTLSAILVLIAGLAAPAAPFSLPEPETIRLDNGLVVYYLQDARTPMVSFRFLVRGAGNANEPESLEGLSDLVGTLLPRGAGGATADKIAEELEFMGAGLQVEVENEYVSMSAHCLAEYFPRLLEMATACLRAADFPAAEFKQEKQRRAEQIQALKDDPREALPAYFAKAYCGRHPFGRLDLGTEASLGRLQLKDVKAFYRQHYRPDRVSLAVVGDISRDRFQALLAQGLARWANPAGPAPADEVPPLPVPKGRRCIIVDKPDATQSYFLLGTAGLSKADPAWPQAEVFNTLFGDRFTSWLNAELRYRRGLTYGARSDFMAWRDGGIFVIGSFTRNEKLGEMLEVTLQLAGQARSEGFGEAEIASAKAYIQGHFPPTLETAGQKAAAYVELPFYGFGFDHYRRHLEQVDQVTAEQAREAARRLLSQEDYILVVVGKAAEIRPLVEPFGPVEVKRLSDPGF